MLCAAEHSNRSAAYARTQELQKMDGEFDIREGVNPEFSEQ